MFNGFDRPGTFSPRALGSSFLPTFIFYALLCHLPISALSLGGNSLSRDRVPGLSTDRTLGADGFVCALGIQKPVLRAEEERICTPVSTLSGHGANNPLVPSHKVIEVRDGMVDHNSQSAELPGEDKRSKVAVSLGCRAYS